MFVFLVLALPIGFVLLELAVYPRDEASTKKRAFCRGLLASIPMLVAARILGAIVPEAPGTVWNVFHEWADRILPYAFLPAVLYSIFYRYSERLQPGVGARRLSSFYAGALAPVGLAESVRLWGSPAPYELFILPLLLASMVLIMPRLVLELRAGYGSDLVFLILEALGGSLLAALVPMLFLLRLWPLAWLIAGAALWFGWRFASPELSRRPPVSND